MLYSLTEGEDRWKVAVNQAPGAGQMVVVDNWFEELNRKMHPARR